MSLTTQKQVQVMSFIGSIIKDIMMMIGTMGMIVQTIRRAGIVHWLREPQPELSRDADQQQQTRKIYMKHVLIDKHVAILVIVKQMVVTRAVQRRVRELWMVTTGRKVLL